MGHRFAPVVLREYDIRGVVGETLDNEDAHALGRSFGTVVARGGGRYVAVGYDGRTASPELEAALVEGLAAAGLVALRIGRGPSPALYYAVHALEADAGVMVTGSHNPPDHNGFKMMLGKAAFWGDDIVRLGALAAAGDWVAGDGHAVDVDIMPSYVARLLTGYRGTRDLTVVWDPGNGAAGEVVAAVAQRLPGRHIVLNGTIDGSFPAHHPDPTVAANLAQLRQAVADHGADLGVAFDGDGDRIGAVDGQGRILWGDQLLAVLASEVLPRCPGAPVIGDVKASRMLFDRIAQLGGRPVMSASGNTVIKTRRAELDAPLAGEMSGHIFFGDRFYGFDDGVYVAIRLIDYVSRAGRSLAEMRDDLPTPCNTPEIRMPVDEARKFAVVSEVAARLAGRPGMEIVDLDGLRVTTADGWWLLRASNTESLLVLRCEADDEAGLGRVKAQLRAELEASGITPGEF